MSGADFRVLQREPVTLGSAAGQKQLFEFVFVFHDVDVSEDSVLSYMVKPGASGIKFSIMFMPQAKDIVSNDLPAHGAHAHQHVIAAAEIEDSHQLMIKVSAGSGVFSDIVHMYRSLKSS